jgi:acetoin utilization deacetylase AcuC-like enzyme/formylglycine-generating enzyme required for sulfatase activity
MSIEPLHVKAIGTCLLALALLAGCRRQGETAAPTPQITTTKSGIEMVLIPGGSFEMGSDQGSPDDAPVHKVTISPFWMDRCEVVQEEFRKYERSDPSHFKGPRHPLEQINWTDAAGYCNDRSLAEGLEPCYNDETWECNFSANGYRLPTEAEWEYACRAGTRTRYSFGDSASQLAAHAWHAENAAKTTHPVGQKKPNPWGLYDMHGNVSEWCHDRYAKDYYRQSPDRDPRGPAAEQERVIRGGAWNSSTESCRSAYRASSLSIDDTCLSDDAIGFRCVRNAPSSMGVPPMSRTAVPAVKTVEVGPNTHDFAMRTAVPIVSVKAAKTHGRDAHATGGQDALGTQGRDALATGPHGRDAHATGGQDTRATAGGGTMPSQSQPKSKTGFVYDDIYLEHKTTPRHPESPARLTAILEKLKAGGVYTRLIHLTPKAAPLEQIHTIHSPRYVERACDHCATGEEYLDSPDVPISRKSYAAALMAVGGVLRAIDAVMQGQVRNAFCAVRPPGHHAVEDRAMGFCLFNNVAIGARYVQQRYGLSKVLIVDWDVHHGNGTQAAFYDDPSVLYFSVHQYPFYPGSGSAAEKGRAKGLNHTINVPLPGRSGDPEYLEAFETRLRPAALAFAPQFVLISAGFDAHEDDTLGGMQVTTEGFGRLTRIVRGIADQCCEGRLVSVLEGGYGLQGLAASVETHLRVLMD